MKFKKRYVAVFLSVGLIITTQMEFLAFRKSENKQLEYLAKRGQTDVTFDTFEVDGQKIHSTHVGNDTLPLAVFVHGAPGSSSGMLDYLADPTLTKVAQMVAVDRPGYGYSGFGKAERSLEKQALALKPILEKYRKTKAVLVGHSFGGPVIARAAMDFPELVDGLVVVAGSIDPSLEPRHWWQKPLDWIPIRWMLPPTGKVSNEEILPLPEELEKMLPFWEKITCPVTVIQGMKDELVEPGNAEFARKMLVNSARLDMDTIQGKGHFILWTMKDHIAQKIIEQLEVLK